MNRYKSVMAMNYRPSAGSWALVALKDIDYSPLKADVQQGIYPSTFWLRSNPTTHQPEARRGYFTTWQNVDWDYVQEYLQSIFMDKRFNPDYIVLEGNDPELALMHSFLEISDPITLQRSDDHSKYSVIGGYHRLLMLSNCAFDLPTVAALGWSSDRMTLRGERYHMRDHDPADNASIPALVV